MLPRALSLRTEDLRVAASRMMGVTVRSACVPVLMLLLCATGGEDANELAEADPGAEPWMIRSEEMAHLGADHAAPTFEVVADGSHIKPSASASMLEDHESVQDARDLQSDPQIQITLDGIILARKSRFTAARHALTMESWASGLWNILSIPVDMLSRFPKGDVLFPKLRNPTSCMKCGAVPVVSYQNINGAIKVALNTTCGDIDAFYCLLRSQPSRLRMKFANAAERSRHLEMSGWGTMKEHCDGNELVPLHAEMQINAEAVRVGWVNRSRPLEDWLTAPHFDVHWSTFISCQARPELEHIRRKALQQFVERNGCTAHPPNIAVVVVDMTSRISFLWQAPATSSWLEDVGANPNAHDHLVFDMQRMNIIGRSTPQALNALFAGEV